MFEGIESHVKEKDGVKSEVYLMDCMELMKKYPDGYFDLAVVDPPYGLSEDGKKNHSRVGLSKPKMYTPKNWDKNKLNKCYFDELIRVSKNQIIWGANHFISKLTYDSSCWLVWDKENIGSDFADCELAWSSFKTSVRLFRFRWSGMLQKDMKNKEQRIHPTQKPVALYDWIFKNYATEGMKILDSHLGSGSSRISAHKYKMNFTGCELDKEYFDASVKRYSQFTSQTTLF